jgi:hypothetical protein
MTLAVNTLGRHVATIAIAASISITILSREPLDVRAAPSAGDVDAGTVSAPVGQSAAECPIGAFLGDLKAHPSNAAYPPPSVSVTCTDAHVVVRTNGIPTFPFVAKTPNSLRAQDYVFRFTRTPIEVSTPGSLNLGTIGVAIDGLPIYGPFEAPRDGTADPASDGILDDCGGHTGPAGEYHVHATPACLPADLMATPGAVVGYALDGYPIVSPVVCDDEACTLLRTVRSGWVQVSGERNVWLRHAWQDGAGDLDRCNGLTGADGQYRYYAVSTFPYFMGCYHGAPGVNGGVGGTMRTAVEAVQGAMTGRSVPSGSNTTATASGQPIPPRVRR